MLAPAKCSIAAATASGRVKIDGRATAAKLTAGATSPRAIWVSRLDDGPLARAEMTKNPMANASVSPAAVTRLQAARGSNRNGRSTDEQCPCLTRYSLEVIDAEAKAK